jgi:hypothetical protein
MRNFVLGLAACLAFAGFSKADVVAFYNIATTSTSSSSSDIRIAFTAQAGASVSGFKLFATQNNSTTTKLSAQFIVDNGVGFKTITSNTKADGAFFFDLTGAGWSGTGLQNLSANSYGLDITSFAVAEQSASGGTTAYDTTSNSSITLNSGLGFTSAAYFGGSTNARFEVYTVPEPGTLLLGGIAACSGAAGAWWKRRKRKTTQPETADQPATA